MDFSSRHILPLFLVVCLAAMVSCSPITTVTTSATAWSECSVTCGGGTQTRTVNGQEEEQECNTGDCPAIDGGWGEFSVSYCFEPMCEGATTLIQTRSCDNPKPANGGASCTGPSAQVLFNRDCPFCSTTTDAPNTTEDTTTLESDSVETDD